MELSHEDSLRLNVLIKQDLLAIRIDESSMTVHALTAKGEAKVQLNPNCREDLYLRRIRELFSTHALGSPGGYPVYLKRWTRMGQMRQQSLDSLLLLGEPEAIIAVAHAPGLTEQVARRAWWVMPSAEVARKMLECAAVATSALGRELAAYLIEFLPFEERSLHVVDSVRLVLQPGLVDEAVRQSLWKKALRKSAFYVGFLFADPENLPEACDDHAQLSRVAEKLQRPLQQGNPLAAQLLRLLGKSGQSYLQTVEKAMDKLADQEVAVALIKALQGYFRQTWPADYQPQYPRLPEDIDAAVTDLTQGQNALPMIAEVLQAAPQLSEKVDALLKLSLAGEPLLNPIFSQTDAVGSVMRKRLQPVTQWILANVLLLQS